MKKTLLALSLALALFYPHARGVFGIQKERTVEDEIWALEETYLTLHRDAKHEAIPRMWHDRFLGWPDLEPGPTDKEAVTRRLKRKYPEPATWEFEIERAGIHVVGDVAVNYYTLHFVKQDENGRERRESRRTMHTWIKDGSQWKILGGMSKQLEGS